MIILLTNSYIKKNSVYIYNLTLRAFLCLCLRYLYEMIGELSNLSYVVTQRTECSIATGGIPTWHNLNITDNL